MKIKSKLLLFCLLVTSISGCSSMFDSVISCEMGIRNKVLAQKAWGHWSWCYDNLDYPFHFAKGFKAGYQDVLRGGSGCQPTLPPKCYWKPGYQTPEGRSKTNSWFDGFSHGALAAQQDGYGNMGEIPISPTARANIEASRQRHNGNALSATSSQGQPLNPISMPPASQGNFDTHPPPPVEGGGIAPTGPAGQDAMQIPPVRPYE